MIHAIVDIGSNTIRLAVYKIADGKLELLIKKKHTVGLAAYIENNRMMPDGVDKACEVLEEYKIFLQNFNITNVTAFTTAALRNVANSKEAVGEIITRTGIDVTVISGEEEARFDFVGATRVMEQPEGILIDIGGASTELVVYRDEKILQMISMPIGSLAMYREHVAGLLPTKEEITVIREAAEAEFDKAVHIKGGVHPWICGIGGTFKGAGKLNNAFFHLPEENMKIDAVNIEKIIDKLECNSKEVSNEILEVMLNVVPERIKTIVPGLVILDVLVKHFKSQSITVSDSGVREGFIYDKIIGT